MWIPVSVLSWALVVGMASAHSTGAPAIACSDMTPLHGVDPQPPPSPYSLTYSEIGTGYNVVLEAAGGDSFKGFFIQAREPGTSNLIGAFNFDSSDIQYVDCSGGTNNAVTHTSSSEKTKIEVTWEPSIGFTGEAVFTASVVRAKTEFWVRQESDVIIIQS
ncbi:unnamed protein product [Meganyctiphanes norvegica]|uniref:Reelin domain-containing protein n=1 Tax=Meganyctiphanes norvegica TaxID=48144 RepID=A0AAV2RSA6_MEGNR